MTTTTVFAHWLYDHPAIDMIEFADIPRPRRIGERQSYTGPVITIKRAKDL